MNKILINHNNEIQISKSKLSFATCSLRFAFCDLHFAGCILPVAFCLLPFISIAQLSVDVSTVNPTCFGYTNGQATANVTGGTPPFQYSWSNGQNNGQTVNGIKAGNYSVNVSDAKGLFATKSFTLGQPTQIIPTSTIDGTDICTTTAYIASATGGVGTYTYSWQNLLTGTMYNSQRLPNPTSGSYQLYVTDAQGCTATKVLNLQQPLSVVVHVGDVVCGGTCDGAAEAVVTGGYPPYTYQWDFKNSTGQQIAPLPGGTYTVIVTDSKGCVKIATGSVYEPPVLKASVTTTNQCTNSATANVSATGGKQPYVFKWSNGAVGSTVSGLTQGVYFVSVFDASGCNFSIPVNVSDVSRLKINVTKTDAACTGNNTGTASVQVTGYSQPPFTYKWSTGDTAKTTLTNLAPGAYSVSVTDAAGCSTSSAVSVGSATSFTFQTGSVNSLCGGASGSASVTGITGGAQPYSYLWNNGATTSSITNVAPGSYSVVVSDATGCKSTSTQVVVGSTNSLAATVKSVDAVCQKTTGTLTITAQGGTAPYTFTSSLGTNTTGIFTNVAVGNYTVTVTDAGGCGSAQVVASIKNTNQVLSTNVTANNAKCTSSNGSITLATSGGNAPYTFDGGSIKNTTGSFTGLAKGTYNFIITDALGCQTTASAKIDSSYDVITANVSTKNASCIGSDGAITVVANGGTAPYSYSSNFGNNTTGIFASLASGNYTVTVTDASGCKSTSTPAVVKNSNSTLATIVNVSNAKCSSNSGAVLLVVTGGKAPYTFQTGTTKNNNGYFTGLKSGTYNFTIIDSVGCQSSAIAKVDSSVDVLLANATVKNTFCGNSDGSFTVTASGGTAPYSFSNGISTNATGIFTGLKAANYTVSITDANGCAITNVTANVSVDALDLKIKVDVSKAICASKNGSILLTPAAGKAPYTFDAGVIKNQNGYFTNLASGTYNFTVTDGQGCPAKISVKVDTINFNLKINPIVTDATCNNPNGRVSIDIGGGSPPYSYTSTLPIDLTKVPAGTYQIIASDGNGCTSAATAVTIKSVGRIKANFTNTPIGCNGTDSLSVSFTNSTVSSIPNYTSTWIFSEGKTSNASNPSVSFKNPTATAKLIVSNSAGCFDTLTTSLNLDVVRYTLTNTQATCQGLQTKLNVLGSNPNLTYKYKWTAADSVSVIAGDTTASPTVVVAKQGTGKVYLLISSSLGCSKRDSVLLQSVNPNVDATNLKYTQDCNSKKVTFNFSNSATASQYCWFFGDSPTSTSCALNPTYTYSSAGNYIARLVPTSLTCLSALSIPVKVRDGAVVSVKADTTKNVCDATSITVSAKSNVSSFQWSNSPAFATILGSGQNLLVKPINKSNTYYVRVTDSTGVCVATDSVVVNNNQLKISHALNADVCTKTSSPFIVTNTSSDSVSVVWTSSTLIDGSNTVLSPKIKAGSTGYIIGYFKNAFGCQQTDTVQIVPHVVKVAVLASASVIYTDEKVQLNATPTGAGYIYQWTPADGLSSATIAAPIATPKADTRYQVLVTDNFGCSDTASVGVKVLTPQCSDPYIFVPRAFSPNGDGTNDKAFVRGDYLTSVEFSIYNRWGELVFKTTDKTIGWDGTFKGQMVCPDVYGYYVTGVCQKGEPFFLKGNITVMK